MGNIPKWLPVPVRHDRKVETRKLKGKLVEIQIRVPEINEDGTAGLELEAFTITLYKEMLLPRRSSIRYTLLFPVCQPISCPAFLNENANIVMEVSPVLL